MGTSKYRLRVSRSARFRYAAIVFFAFSLSACTDEIPAVTVASLQSELDADQESWGVVLHISENGLPRLNLTASHVLKYDRPDSTFMLLQSTETDSSRVLVHIFSVEGDSSAIVVADRIYYYEREGRFVAQGDVVVTSSENVRIESEHLVWTEEDRKIRTAGFATIILPEKTIAGYSLEANEDLSDTKLARITGTFFPEEQ